MISIYFEDFSSILLKYLLEKIIFFYITIEWILNININIWQMNGVKRVIFLLHQNNLLHKKYIPQDKNNINLSIMSIIYTSYKSKIKC